MAHQQPKLDPKHKLLTRGYVHNGVALDLYGYWDDEDVVVCAVVRTGDKEQIDLGGLLGDLVLEKLSFDAERAIHDFARDDDVEPPFRAEVHPYYEGERLRA